jgi:hypothetical protein
MISLYVLFAAVLLSLFVLIVSPIAFVVASIVVAAFILIWHGIKTGRAA